MLFAGISLPPAISQQAFRNDQVNAAEAQNGGAWGNWTRPVYCPSGSWAAGYTMRIEPQQGRGDDTALNAIALYCRDRYGNTVARIAPHDGFWGEWVEGAYCRPGKFLTLFKTRVEPSQGGGDDTAANSVAFWCSEPRTTDAGGSYLEAHSGYWGDWSNWTGRHFGNTAICGLMVKIEDKQGKGDDTALNSVQFYWCNTLGQL